jgi:hypothetical protein
MGDGAEVSLPRPTRGIRPFKPSSPCAGYRTRLAEMQLFEELRDHFSPHGGNPPHGTIGW